METQSRIQVAVLKMQNREYPLYKGLNVIGRNKAATVNIVNLNVSQNHAVIIEVDETQHYLSDMNSSNGTHLHGTKLKPLQLYELNDDSHIIIGTVDARYFKLSQSVVVSNTSIQGLNNTQSMSQSMYACSTQLITDETISESNTQNQRQLRLHSIPPPPKFTTEHSYTNRSESQAVDIHEAATQVVTYPERRSPLPPSDVHFAATQLVEEHFVEIGIHDEATQVVDLPETIERNKNVSLPPQKEKSVENEAPHNQKNNPDLHDSVDVRSTHLDEDSEATNIGSQGSVQLLMTQPVFHNRHCYHDSQEPSTSMANTNQQKVVNDSFQTVNLRSDSNVVVEESLDNISRVSDDLLTDEFPTGELETSLHEGDTPGPNKFSGRQRMKLCNSQEDRMQKKSESNESQSSDIGSSKNPPKKLEPAESVGSDKLENDTEGTDDIIATKKKPLRKLDSTQESDSDTDIECSPVIGDSQRIKPVLQSRKAIIDSDTDTDIENKENMKNCNNNVNNSVNKQLCDSDSDTEIEDEDTNKVSVKVEEKDIIETPGGKIKTTQVDSSGDKKVNEQNDDTTKEKNKANESDCARVEYSDKEEAVTTNCKPPEMAINDSTASSGNNVVEHQTAESDSDTDIEDNNHKNITTKICKLAEGAAEKADDDSHNNFGVKCNISSKNVSGGFNDSDCIPATQDAFALAFNYGQKNEKINTDSSEESFKLGLTELMEGSQNSERLRKSDGRNAEEPITEGTEQCDMNAHKGDKHENDQLKDLQLIERTDIAESVDLTTQKIEESDQEIEMQTQKIDVPEEKEEEDDEVYIMPTQKLDIPNTFTESEQFKIPSKKFTFKKKALQLERSITTMLSTQSDDMYIMPTQKLNEDGSSQKGDDDDDLYIAATQVIGGNLPKEVDDTAYILPTQKLTAPSTDCVIRNEDEDVVINKFNLEVNHPEAKEIVGGRGNECDLDEFDVPTQVIESGGNRSVISECDIGKSNDKNLFEVPTQVFNGPDDSQSEFSGFQKPDEIERKVLPEKNSVKSITLSQFENFAHSTAKSLNQNTAITDEDRPETLSQIETFIQQPLNHGEQREDVKKLSHQKNSFCAPANSKTGSTRRIRSKESLDKTDLLTEVNERETNTDENVTLSSTSDRIRKDIIKTIENSVSSKENSNSRARSNRKKSCDSDTKVTIADTDNSGKLQTESKKDKRKKIGTPEIKNEVELKSSDKTEISSSACESGTNGELSNVKHDKKLEIKSNSKSTRSKKTETSEKVKAPKRNDDTDSDSASNTTSNRRKRKASYDSEKDGKSLAAGKNSNIEAKTKLNIRSTGSRNGEPCKLDTNEVSAVMANDGSNKSLSKMRKEESHGKSTAIKCISDIKSDTKMDVESTKRKRKGSSDSATKDAIDVKYDNNVEGKSSKFKTIISTRSSSRGRDTAKKGPAAKMEAEAEKRGKSCEKTTAADGDENIGSEITLDVRTRRMTRKNSSDSEQTNSSLNVKASSSRKRRVSCDSDEKKPVEENEVGKPTSTRKRTRNATDLEVIPESEAGDNDNVKIKPPEIPEFVSRNKTKNYLGGSKINDEMLKMEDDDSGDFCISTSKPTKSRNPRKAAVDVIEWAGTKPSTSTAPEETTATKTKRMRKTASKNATSAASADDGDRSTPSTPRKTGRDLSESLSTPERNKRRQKPKVVFTMLDSPQLESDIKHLGGSVVDTVDTCNVLVTEHVKRSMKLLTAVGQGKPICSPDWIKASKNAHEFLDPWNYILIDETAESKWDFSLKESLQRASRKKLFENYIFQIMTTNAVDVLKGAIQSCGGRCSAAKKTPADAARADNFILVATADQKSRFQRIQGLAPNVVVVEPEAIFDGVLRQEIRFSKHLLT